MSMKQLPYTDKSTSPGGQKLADVLNSLEGGSTRDRQALLDQLGEFDAFEVIQAVN